MPRYKSIFSAEYVEDLRPNERNDYINLEDSCRYVEGFVKKEAYQKFQEAEAKAKMLQETTKSNITALDILHEEALVDNEFRNKCLQDLRNKKIEYYQLLKEFKNQQEFVITALRVDGMNLQCIPKDYQVEKDYILIAVTQNWEATRFLHRSYRRDSDIFRAAMKQNPDLKDQFGYPWKW